LAASELHRTGSRLAYREDVTYRQQGHSELGWLLSVAKLMTVPAWGGHHIFRIAIACLLITMSSAAVGYGVQIDIVISEFARHCFVISGTGFTASAVAVIAGLDEIDTGTLRTWLPGSWRLRRHISAQQGSQPSFHWSEK
jgi:hypothetical protein